MPDVETLREWLKYSPSARDVPAGATDLKGFVADGIEICSECCGRLMARGCRLGDKMEPVYDRTVTCELCGEEP